MNHMRPLVLLLIIFKACGYCPSGSRVDFLPGFQGPLPFHLETGYVGVGESEDVQLFYYFVKSERSPEKDPLLLWLTGGPGCSAWSGLVFETGPLKFKIKPYDGTVPTLVTNEYSWTKVSNIIFVDSPSGTGFSYSKNPPEVGDVKQANDLFEFLKKWLIAHPEFKSSSVYIAGDSYSGITIPILVQIISNENDNKHNIIPPINLQGYILGNPVTSELRENNFRIPFARGMSLISSEIYQLLETSCGGHYYDDIDPNNTMCLEVFKAFTKTISGIDVGQILEPTCPRDFRIPHHDDVFGHRRSLGDQISEIPRLDCRSYGYYLCRYWANDPQVREALHIRKGSIGEWQRCNIVVANTWPKDVPDSFHYYVNISAKGYRSLMYSGDHDMMVPTSATQAWIKSLNYSIVDYWRPWLVPGEIAGFTRTYSNGMTFATIKGGGHTAPEYKPKECFAMFERWIAHQPL